METHPEQVDIITADVNEHCQLLQSLAKEVEQEEGRGELKVPYSLLSTDYLCLMTLISFTTKIWNSLGLICHVYHVMIPGGKRTRITLCPTDWQKLPLV